MCLCGAAVVVVVVAIVCVDKNYNIKIEIIWASNNNVGNKLIGNSNVVYNVMTISLCFAIVIWMYMC